VSERGTKKRGYRKHFKIQEFPPEVVGAVNDLISKGVTYPEITKWLHERGHTIAKSSVQRYGQDFAARMERIKVVQKQAKAILGETENPLEMEEATTQMALHMVAEHLLQLHDLGDADPIKVMSVLAKLQSSSAQRTRAQLEFKRRAAEAASKVSKLAKSGGLSDEVIKQIEEEVLGIAA
jgi:hypothetical protein